MIYCPSSFYFEVGSQTKSEQTSFQLWPPTLGPPLNKILRDKSSRVSWRKGSSFLSARNANVYQFPLVKWISLWRSTFYVCVVVHILWQGAVGSPRTGLTVVLRPQTGVLGTELGPSTCMVLTAEPSLQLLSSAFLTDVIETTSLRCGQHHFLLQRRDINLGGSDLRKSYIQ